MDKIKNTVNVKTTYYTREAFRAYYIGLLKNNLPVHRFKEITEDNAKIESLIDEEIARLKVYDGDPYGHIKQISEYGWKKNHEALEEGSISYHESHERRERKE